MTLIDKYDAIFKAMVTEFDEKYFDWERDYYIIGMWGRLAPTVVGRHERYHFSIDHIYEALKHNLNKKKILDWHDYCVESYEKKESPMSLVNYCMWVEEYTKEERKKDKDNIKRTKKLLEDSILEYKRKNDTTKRK